MLAKRVVILLPQLNIPWKKPRGYDKDPYKFRQEVPSGGVRVYWRKFAEMLQRACTECASSVELVELEAWLISPEYVDSLNADLVFVPHRCNLDFQGCNTKVFFYMQVICKWLFTVDRGGWSASSSVYPVDIKALPRATEGKFEEYRTRLLSGNNSKFDQAESRSRLSLILRQDIPLSNYIFFPCQIPTDQSIRYFSSVDEVELVKELVEWANFNKKHVVFKEHPVNKKSMLPLRELVTGPYVRWSDASIHDLIEYSRGVMTINSGVGFESLLHRKPVATFGRVEYDCVTHAADLADIDAVDKYFKRWDWQASKSDYYSFMAWFVSTYAYDLEDGGSLNQRLHIMLGKIMKECNVCE